jgi:O-acetyl-ADP-ribose deacetylase (regulator of RNase III)
VGKLGNKIRGCFCPSHVVLTLQTDVIVNTVANDLNLTRNPCSNAILQEAGSEITTFCERWVNNNGQLQEGHFAITGGAKLKCKKVLHVCCPRWTPSDGEKVTGHLRVW